jgi:heterodisulfide reductase subunit B2
VRRALYLGCATPVKALKYEISARSLAVRLGIEFVDVPEFGCCGFPVKSIDPAAALLMAARNLAVAEARGLDIVGLCTGCVAGLAEAKEELQDEAQRERVNAGLRKLGIKEYGGKVAVKHLARFLIEDYGLDALRSRIVAPLDSLKVGIHYGCHYARPSHAHQRFDDPSRPATLDTLMESTGAKSIDYPNKDQCCGLTIMAQAEDVSMKLVAEKLECVSSSGADAMVVACPSCCMAYENNQRLIGRKAGKEYNLPVLFFTQVLGRALGMNEEELGSSFNRIPFKPDLHPGVER